MNTVMARPVHFEIHCDDIERATKFYSTVFGWEIKKWDGAFDYWLVTTGDKTVPGIDGALIKRQHPKPTGAGINSYINVIPIDNIDETIELINQNGGKIVASKQSIEGVGTFVYFTDTEGNQACVIQGIKTDEI